MHIYGMNKPRLSLNIYIILYSFVAHITQPCVLSVEKSTNVFSHVRVGPTQGYRTLHFAKRRGSEVYVL